MEDNSKSKERPTAVTPQEARGTSALEALKALAEGFATTFRHLFRKPVTEEYPEYRRPLPERARARIVLTRDPDG
ncbi:MAG: hypothetical protein WCD46_15535, partial [Desulfobacterales bacterium]